MRPNPELAVVMEPQEGVSVADQLALATACDDIGVDVFRSDHYLPWQQTTLLPGKFPSDALVTLGALSQVTHNIRFGSLVSPMLTHRPQELILRALTLSELSVGRFDLGVGAGWNLAEASLLGLPRLSISQRLSRLRTFLEAWSDLKRFGGTEEIPIDSHWATQVARATRGTSLPRLVVGISHSSMLSAEMAIWHADEVNVGYCSRHHFAVQVMNLEKLCEQAHLQLPRISTCLSMRVTPCEARLCVHGDSGMLHLESSGESQVDVLEASVQGLHEAGADRVFLQFQGVADHRLLAAVGALARRLDGGRS